MGCDGLGLVPAGPPQDQRSAVGAALGLLALAGVGGGGGDEGGAGLAEGLEGAAGRLQQKARSSFMISWRVW